jgi:Na+-translocating ferredoxin:NAD+ oxidoreductase RnfG subunit
MKASQWAFIPLAIISTSAYATAYLTVEQAQRAIFPGTSFVATAQSGVWRTSNGGYFVVDRVVGKHEFITIAVGINANGTVKQIEIMDYRESYGYEVRDAAWRAQFVGKSANSPLQLNADIKNISGATLSSKHVTDGVKRILQKYESGLKGG